MYDDNSKFALEKVSMLRKKDIINYIRELYKYNSRINGVGRLQDYVTETKENFQEWFYRIQKEEAEELNKKCYLFIRKSDNALVGMINIRMNRDLKTYPFGHIGYSIRPTERNKGYGKIQFYFALRELYNNSIYTCQMACKNDNLISKKLIISLGGVYEKSIGNEDYYLIDVKKSLSDNLDIYSKFI